MSQPSRRLIVPDEPDYFTEAQHLMNGYFRFAREEGNPLPWHQQPLVTRAEWFALSPEDMAAAFGDVRDYLGRVRIEAEALLSGQPHLAPFFEVCTIGGKDLGSLSFMEGALTYVAADTALGMGRDAFVQACLLQVREWAGDLEQFEVDEQQQLEQLVDPAFDMGTLFDVVNRAQVSDAHRMLLLRFFQEIDHWYVTVRDLLAALEDICRRHFPLVRQRFVRKVQALRAAGAQAEPLMWLNRWGTNLAGLRPEDLLTLNVNLNMYNGLGFRLSLDRRLPLRTHYGILFKELDDLQDKRRARDELTERQLKAIADPTRLAIVRRLWQADQYVQQLADDLNLSAATLSHHLNALLVALLVGVRPQGCRSYYHLNRGELSALLDDLNRLTKPNEENP